MLILPLLFIIPVFAEGWVSPSGFEDPKTGWCDPENVYDENLGSYSETGALWSVCNMVSELILTHAELYCGGLRFYKWNTFLLTIEVDIWLLVDGDWVQVVDNAPLVGSGWYEAYFDGCYTTKAKIVLHPTGLFGATKMRLYEFDFWEIEAGGEEYERSASQNLSVSCASSRMLEASRTTNQGIGFSVVGVRLTEISKYVAQALTTSFDSGRLAEFFRSTTQGIKISLESIGEKIGEYFREVAITISVALESARLAEWFKTVTQIISVATQAVSVIVSSNLSFILAAVSFAFACFIIPLGIKKEENAVIFALCVTSLSFAVAAMALKNFPVAALGFVLAITTLALTLMKGEKENES